MKGSPTGFAEAAEISPIALGSNLDCLSACEKLYPFDEVSEVFKEQLNHKLLKK